MTDGERLVWASSFALSLDQGHDAVVAAEAAAAAIARLREAAIRRNTDHNFVIVERDVREFIDEIVNAP